MSDELTDALAQLEQVLAAGDGPVHLPTNLGLTRMADACGIPYDVLAWTAEWYVREETLRAGNLAIISYHQRMLLAPIFGAGTGSVALPSPVLIPSGLRCSSGLMHATLVSPTRVGR